MCPTDISHMDARDLIGKFLYDETGEPAVVTGLRFDAADGLVRMVLDRYDEATDSLAGTPFAVLELAGWVVTAHESGYRPGGGRGQAPGTAARVGSEPSSEAVWKAEGRTTTITQMDARDLVGRIVYNPNNVGFVVVDLGLDARTGRVLIGLDELTPDGDGLRGWWSELFDLSGWQVGARAFPLVARPVRATFEGS